MSQSNENGSFIGNETVKKVIKLLTSHRKEDILFGIQAPPGSGKSTLLIKGIHETMTKIVNKDESKTYRPFRIFVVEPTVPATTGLYNYMNDKYGKSLKIGYSAERDVRYNDKSELVYCTGGHMENKLIALFKDGKATSDWDFCDVMILDESDRGSLDYETIIALWLTADAMGKNVPRLILMSATLSMKDLGFEGFNLVKANYVPFSVKTSYIDKRYRVDDTEIYKDTGRLVYQTHISTPVPEKGVSEKLSREEGREVILPGYSVWIVFCPGKKEVLSCANTCKKLYEDNNGINLDIMMVYGGMGAEGYKKIFEAPEEGTRRIIFCTNIIEASVTVPYADGVFDTCRAKYNVATASGANCLTLGFTSKASAKQRSGRTGRLCPGFCIRIIPKDDFDKLDEQQIPEAMRVPLHNTIIKLRSVGLNPLDIFRNRINEVNVDTAMKALFSLGMLKINKETEEEEVTEIGRFAVLFPVSVYASAMLYHWNKNHPDDIFMGVVTICLIDGFDEGYFYYPNTEKTGVELELDNKEYFEEHFLKFAGKTDIETLIILWHHIMYSLGTIRPKIFKLKKWCMKHSINSKKISECLSTIFAVCKIIHRESNRKSEFKFEEIKMKKFSKTEAIKYITPILVDVYSFRDSFLFNVGKMEYKIKRGDNKFKLSTRNPMTSNKTKYKEIIPLRLKTISSTSSRPGNTYITFFAPHKGDYFPDSDDIEYDEKEEVNRVEKEDDDEENESDDEMEEDIRRIKRTPRKKFIKNREPMKKPGRVRRELSSSPEPVKRSPKAKSSKKELSSSPEIYRRKNTSVGVKKISTSSSEVIIHKKPIRKFSTSSEEIPESKAKETSSTVSDSEEEKPIKTVLRKVSIKKPQARKPKKISTSSSDSEIAKVRITSGKSRIKRE